MAKKTWSEKLNSSTEKVVKPAPMNFGGMKKGQMMLIPTPSLIAEYIESIPRGEDRGIPVLRQELAALHGAEVSCPVTTGIHLRTVAEAAFETLDQGADLTEITPIWRVLNAAAPTVKKLSFDPAILAEQRAAEGLDP